MDKDHIALYAATLSTILLIVKFYEMWRDRFRLEAWLSIDGPDQDKELMVINLTKNPIHIKHLELVWMKSRWQYNKGIIVSIDNDVATNIQIGPYASKSIKFEKQDNFAIKTNSGNLWVRFKIAGRSGFCTRKIH